MIRDILCHGTLLAMSTFGAGALLLTACGGRATTTSPQTSDGQLQSVAIADISGPVSACKTGFAHPNVCCEAGPTAPAACGVYAGAPFRSCASGRTTFPDPRSCCALDGSGACEPAPSPTPTPPISSCTFPCPPGWFDPSAGPSSEPGVCCTYSTTGIVCIGEGGGGSASGSGGSTASGSSGKPPATASTGGGSTGPGVGCACPVCLPGETCVCDCPDASTTPPPPPICACPICLPGETCACDCPDASTTPPPPHCACSLVCVAGGPCPPPCDCPDASTTPPPPPPPPVCNACPPGWQVPVGDPFLCCTETASGIIECFSRGVPPTPEPATGGVSTPGGTATSR